MRNVRRKDVLAFGAVQDAALSARLWRRSVVRKVDELVERERRWRRWTVGFAVAFLFALSLALLWRPQ